MRNSNRSSWSLAPSETGRNAWIFGLLGVRGWGYDRCGNGHVTRRGGRAQPARAADLAGRPGARAAGDRGDAEQDAAGDPHRPGRRGEDPVALEVARRRRPRRRLARGPRRGPAPARRRCRDRPGAGGPRPRRSTPPCARRAVSCCSCWTTASTSSTPAPSSSPACSAPAPGLRVLATSRESLGVDGETVWRLEPLAPGTRIGCSSSGRAGAGRIRARRRHGRRRSPASASGSTACRWRSSLRRRAVSVMSQAELLAGPGDAARRRSAAAPGLRPRTTAPSARRSSGATSSSTPPSRRPSAASPSSPAASTRRRGGARPRARRPTCSPARGQVARHRPAEPAGKDAYRLLETVREYAPDRLAEAGERDAARGSAPAPLLRARGRARARNG